MLYKAFFVILILRFNECDGHGRLLQPVARSSLRFKYQDFQKFGLPINYDDNQLFCGGFHIQQANGGKCGICGDPWDGARDHEAGGKYAPGFAVESYTEGDIIDVTVQLTANHLGWFEFRICPNEDFSTPATQQCLDQNLLKITDPSGLDTRYFVDKDDKSVALRLQLPPGLVCTTQCVFQWKYNAGNSWGVDPDGTACVGCGPQEQFYGCSDVTISPSSGATTTTSTTSSSTGTTTTTTDGSSTAPANTPTTTSSTTAASTTEAATTTTTDRSTAASKTPTETITTTTTSTTKTTTTTTDRSTKASTAPAAGGNCVAVGAHKMTPGMTNWCKMNCPAGNCPLSHCSTDCCAIYQVQCTGTPPPSGRCEAAWANDPGTSKWCNDNCSRGYCPMSHCSEDCCKIYNC